jgi:hypothetical protein
MPLSVLEGNRQLESVTLMLGALRGPGARSAADVVRTLRSLPALRELALLGVAGGFDANGGGSGALTLALAEHLAGPAAAPAARASSPGGTGGSGGGSPRSAAWRPRRLRRLELVAWGVPGCASGGGGAFADGGAGSAEALLPRVRRVAPELEVVVREEWAG